MREHLLRRIVGALLAAVAPIALTACGARGNDQGTEYAPNMYHAVSYEPLTQIVDENAGAWANSLDSGRAGEYYNSNPINPSHMTMRTPPPHTVKRNPAGRLPYRLKAEDLEQAAVLQSPFATTPEVLEEGQRLYGLYCAHCHGDKGNGDGKVAIGVTLDGVEHTPLAGVANLHGDAYKDITEGHIFHVITWGKNLMQAHGSQVSPDDRWKIAKYVKALQQENKAN